MDKCIYNIWKNLVYFQYSGLSEPRGQAPVLFLPPDFDRSINAIHRDLILVLYALSQPRGRLCPRIFRPSDGPKLFSSYHPFTTHFNSKRVSHVTNLHK